MRKIFLAFVAAVALLAQSGPDPYEGVVPHEIPSCDPGGRRGAKCACGGMVASIRRKRTEACWERVGVVLPADMPVEVREKLIRSRRPTKEVEACLAEVPDHCRIIATFATEDYAGCRTKCKPERCGCPDAACKSHEESNEY